MSQRFVLDELKGKDLQEEMKVLRSGLGTHEGRKLHATGYRESERMPFGLRAGRALHVSENNVV